MPVGDDRPFRPGPATTAVSRVCLSHPGVSVPVAGVPGGDTAAARIASSPHLSPADRRRTPLLARSGPIARPTPPAPSRTGRGLSVARHRVSGDKREAPTRSVEGRVPWMSRTPVAEPWAATSRAPHPMNVPGSARRAPRRTQRSRATVTTEPCRTPHEAARRTRFCDLAAPAEGARSQEGVRGTAGRDRMPLPPGRSARPDQGAQGARTRGSGTDTSIPDPDRVPRTGPRNGPDMRNAPDSKVRGISHES